MLVGVCLVLAYASSASAAVTLKRLGTSPFSQTALSSEADLRTMVETHSTDLQTGFAKAGSPELFPEFMSQFPTAKVEAITVAPGERFDWMLFRKKSPRQVVALKDVTWDGQAAFDAFRFYIDKDGQRYEFIVPAVCGNLSLNNIDRVPPPEPIAPVVVAPPEPVTPVSEVAEHKGGPVVDVGFAHQFDPASYVFARGGYEVFLTESISAMGLVGGFARVGGHDGGSAFTADALLNYYLTEKMFVGAGAGFWVGEDDNIDLIVNIGYLIYETPGTMKTSLFIEGRCEADELVSSMATRLGAGLRFQF
ncbi:MAG: hypothetical protein N2A40_01120 [Desulfobulbaceae bacterium]